ncbi:MAG: hypothetical protein ACRD2O_08795 [Terriglobia bacterium]
MGVETHACVSLFRRGRTRQTVAANHPNPANFDQNFLSVQRVDPGIFQQRVSKDAVDE